MSNINNYDVIIIGAGPAGLSFACSLIELNLKVMLVERSTLSSISNFLMSEINILKVSRVITSLLSMAAFKS